MNIAVAGPNPPRIARRSHVRTALSKWDPLLTITSPDFGRGRGGGKEHGLCTLLWLRPGGPGGRWRAADASHVPAIVRLRWTQGPRGCDFDAQQLPNATVFYLDPVCMQRFLQRIRDTPHHFFLITHQRDYPVCPPLTSEGARDALCHQLLRHPKLLRWYAINAMSQGPKVVPIPLGIQPKSVQAISASRDGLASHPPSEQIFLKFHVPSHSECRKSWCGTHPGIGLQGQGAGDGFQKWWPKVGTPVVGQVLAVTKKVGESLGRTAAGRAGVNVVLWSWGGLLRAMMTYCKLRKSPFCSGFHCWCLIWIFR